MLLLLTPCPILSARWHAFPHNAEPVLMSNYSLSFGFKLTHDLDDRFNLPRKTVLSQRDVPGMTRGLIPVLAANGIIGISEGSNGRVFPGQLLPKAQRESFHLWSGE